MKSKKSRIMGVALTVALLASLFGFAAPVAAQPGDQTWAAQTIPSGTNNVLANVSDVGDISVSSDGTIYIINNDDAVVSGTAGAVLKSTDGGNSFTALAIVVAGGANFLTSIAVAPDDSRAVMVTDNVTAYVSNDSGTTWTALPAKNTAGDITDCDISSAVSGGIVSRHYAITVADVATASVNGRAEIYGPGATWTVIGLASGVVAVGDYMACKFSPSYIGDLALALVWNAGGGVTNLSIISQPGEGAEALTRTSAIGPTSIDYDSVTDGAAANSTVACDIAIPSDWDTSLAAGEVTYVSIATSVAAIAAGVAGRGGATASTTGTGTDDVYRIDAGVPVDLDGSNTVPVHSIAYYGTIDDGTLFLGQRIAASVRYSINPTSMAPTWKTSQKNPTGDNAGLENCTKVVVAPDGKVYAGTRDIWTSIGSDSRSAFSVSTDAGVSFNQTAMIDIGANTTVSNSDFMLTPDGGTIFLSTDEGTDMSLWKSSVPTSAASWERVYCRTIGGPGIVRLGADYADNPSVFWVSTTTNNLYVSHDGGAIFYNRTPPGIILDLAVESGGGSGVLYMAEAATNNIYKSTNGGYFFGLAIPSLLVGAAITNLSMAPMYPAAPEAGHLLVGGPAEVSYSTDGALTFTLIDAGLGAAGNCVVGADEAYATNNTIYTTGQGDGTVYRFVIGTSADWTDLTAGGNILQGLAVSNGVLYASDTGAGAAATIGIHRTVGPLWDAGTMAWEQMSTGAGATATFTRTPNSLRVVNNVLYALDIGAGGGITAELLAYDDFLATATLTLTSPADGATVLVDPVSGRAIDVSFAWQRLGSGTGLVTDFEIQIAESGTNFGAPLIQCYSVVASLAIPGSNTLGLDSTNPVIIIGATGQVNIPLRATTSYEWRVRARDTVAADTIRSQWSETRTINIQAGGAVVETQVGPTLQGPLPGATDVSVNPGFSWTPIAGATLYEFILALDAGLTLTVEDTPVYVTTPSWQVPPGTLEYDTTYFWGAKSTEPTESAQSIGTFRTMSVDVYACPFCTETFGSMGALDSHIAAIHPSATPAYIWAIIVIGAVLMIAVIMLIVKTRRVV